MYYDVPQSIFNFIQYLSLQMKINIFWTPQQT